MNKQKNTGRPRRYLRKRAVAERYGVHERSVDRMKNDGRLPPPDFYNGRNFRCGARIPLTPATALPRCCRVLRAPHENGRPIARAAGRVSVG